jgi:hypothetical protein
MSCDKMVQTVTNARLIRATRGVVSEALTGNKPIDKQSLTLELAFVEMVFKDNNTALVRLRETPTETPFIVQIMSSMIGDNMNVTWIPPGEDIIDKYTGKLGRQPNELLVGLIGAINGSYSENGGVLLGYLHMPGEPAIETMGDAYSINYGESEIVITDNTIELNAETIKINGHDFNP